MDVILDTVKMASGVSLETDAFDPDLLLYINTTIGILSQIGLFKPNELPIIDASHTWDDLLRGAPDLGMVPTYVSFKVRSMFDPPTSSAAAEAMNKILQELEWRIQNDYLISATN